MLNVCPNSGKKEDLKQKQEEKRDRNFMTKIQFEERIKHHFYTHEIYVEMKKHARKKAAAVAIIIRIRYDI